jgi:VWFA-related protein
VSESGIRSRRCQLVAAGAMLLPLLAAAVSLVSAQERQAPEFRSDVRLIRLDVSVVDGRGRPIAGLLPGDFTISEDGRPVEITYFEAVEETAAAVDHATPPARRAARRVVLLVDTAFVSPGQLIRVRESAVRYLREATSVGDWVRIVNMATGTVRDGSIPDDRLRLEATARNLSRRASPWDESVADSLPETMETDAGAGLPSQAQSFERFLSVFSRTSGLLGTLESLFVQLQGVPGRKAVVMISPGFPHLRNFDKQLERVASLAREATAAVYFVDAFGLDGMLPEPGQKMKPAFETAWTRSGGSQDLAEATGGFTYRFGNSLLPALARIGSEMRTYYLLGYVPTRPDDGRFRSVKVKVALPGVTARTKRGYLAGTLR